MSKDSGGHVEKHPRLVELEGWVREGRIDTIIVAITDMQGRLMGKRVQGEAFLNGVIDHGAHFCTYLLGTDMEMNTPEGFALMNWESGYGDWIAVAGLGFAADRAVAGEDGDRPLGHDRRGDPPGDPDLAADDPQAPGRAGDEGRASASRPARSSSTTSSRRRGTRWRRTGSGRRSDSARTTRTTTCSRRRRPSRSTGSCATS